MFGGERSPDIKNPPTSLVDRHNGVRVSSRTEIWMGVIPTSRSLLWFNARDTVQGYLAHDARSDKRGHVARTHPHAQCRVSACVRRALQQQKKQRPYLWCHSLANAHYAHRIARVRRAMYVSWVGQVNHQGGCFAHLLSNTRASSVWNCLSPRQLGLCFGLRCCGGVSRGRVTPCAVA